MPRKGHTEEQIVYALRQAEGGQKNERVCQEVGISQAFYSWKKRFAGLGLNELRELHDCGKRNGRLGAGCGSESGQAHLTGSAGKKV